MPYTPGEEDLVSAVLQSVIGRDRYSLHGYIEFSSPLAQQGIEAICYGLIREDESMVIEGKSMLARALQSSIEVRKDDHMGKPIEQIQNQNTA